MMERGSKNPLPLSTGRAPGLARAVTAMCPEAERIRCFLHKMRNILDKLPDRARAEIKPWLVAVRDAPDHESGQGLAERLVSRYKRDFSSATRTLEDNLEASLAHAKLPAARRSASAPPTWWSGASRRSAGGEVAFTDIERKQSKKYIEQKEAEKNA